MDVSMMCSDSLNVTSLGSWAVKAQWTIAFTFSSSYEYLLSCAMVWYFVLYKLMFIYELQIDILQLE